METRTTAASDGEETRTVEIVFPTDTNSMGTLFGGRALSLMDRLAFIVASRFARKPVVTACSEKVEFRTAVKEGNLIELVGRIGHVGRTSLTVEIDMYSEDLLSGDRNLCTTGQFVLVAVGADGRPTPISSGDTAEVEQPGSHSGSPGSRRGGHR